jgi:hypothetical protein
MQYIERLRKKWVILLTAGILGAFSIMMPMSASACGWWPGPWGCGWNNNGGNAVALGIGLVAGAAIIGAIASSQRPVEQRTTIVYREAPHRCYVMRRHGEYYRVCRT